MNRRGFLAAACGAAITPAWAKAGSPAFLAAAKRGDETYVLCGLDDAGGLLFEVDLPDRGHAAAARPGIAEAVAFARRPGSFALVVDCVEGRETARLHASEGRHFYGHGVFSHDGVTLYTTENALESGEGRIGVWDARDGYRRIGELASGGIGPHDVKLMPDGGTLVVANGGIRTHPDYGREKLNLTTMRPNLTYLDTDGEVADRVELPEALWRNSIRHLAVRGDGLVAAAMQWQGPKRQVVPLLGLHRMGGDFRLLDDPDQASLRGYAGSVAFSGSGEQVAITAPRGNRVQVFDAESGVATQYTATDACGIAAAETGFFVTTGEGRGFRIGGPGKGSTHALTWDNHLVPVGT